MDHHAVHPSNPHTRINTPGTSLPGTSRTAEDGDGMKTENEKGSEESKGEWLGASTGRVPLGSRAPLEGHREG